MKILVVQANPDDQTRLRLETEVREIKARLRYTPLRDASVVAEGAVRREDLQRLLLENEPNVVHFSGHGSRDGDLILEDNAGRSVPVPTRAFPPLFARLPSVQCVLLNSCYSARQAEAIAIAVQCVIGMSAAVSDSAAIAFATAFYQALGFGRSISDAFELARLEVLLLGVAEEQTPRLHLREGSNADKITFKPVRPVLKAEFVTSKNGKPKRSGVEYQLRLRLENVPETVSSVVYQFDDDSIDDQFDESRSCEFSYEIDANLYGDVPIRVVWWAGGRGHGMTVRLTDALKQYYTTPIGPPIARAIVDLEDN
jgi:CHAT domain